MVSISAIILTKNAEDQIADCLDSVAFCDEVVVIDDGSTDRTVEIAKLLNAKVYSLIARSFAEKRNYGAKKAKGKWILYVDADERVSPELASNIRYQISSIKNEYSAFKLQRKNFYFGKHEWPYVEQLERLFKKSALEGWHGDVHEAAVVAGKIGELDGFLLHYTHRDLTSMIEKTIKWSEIEAELRFKAQHPNLSWWRFFRVMLTAFYDSYIKQKGYKAGTAGLVESIYQAFSIFITYARLWEMQNKPQNSNLKTQK